MTWKSTRDWTNRVIDAVYEGILDPQDVMMMCLNYMSEADVEDMCHANDILQDEDYQDE